MHRLPRSAGGEQSGLRGDVPDGAVTGNGIGDRAQRALPERGDVLDALGEALRVEYETIIAGGFLLQLDCPDLARERHNTYQDRPLEEFLAFGNRVIDAINRALRNIPRERVRMHVCWGITKVRTIATWRSRTSFR